MFKLNNKCFVSIYGLLLLFRCSVSISQAGWCITQLSRLPSRLCTTSNSWVKVVNSPNGKQKQIKHSCYPLVLCTRHSIILDFSPAWFCSCNWPFAAPAYVYHCKSEWLFWPPQLQHSPLSWLQLLIKCVWSCKSRNVGVPLIMAKLATSEFPLKYKDINCAHACRLMPRDVALLMAGVSWTQTARALCHPVTL